MEAARAVGALDPGKRAEIVETIRMLTGNLEKIVERGRRADGIVRSMFQHSRGSSEERQPTDLNALAEEALNLAYHGPVRRIRTSTSCWSTTSTAISHRLTSCRKSRLACSSATAASASAAAGRAAHCRRRKPGEQSAHSVPGSARVRDLVVAVEVELDRDRRACSGPRCCWLADCGQRQCFRCGPRHQRRRHVCADERVHRRPELSILLAAHHKTKTAADVAERKRLNHLGLKRRKPPIRSRGLDKTEPQRRASRPLEKWKGFD